jgi:hypothetical protein
MTFHGYAQKAAYAKKAAAKCKNERAQSLWREIADYWQRLEDELKRTHPAKTRPRQRPKSSLSHASAR